MTLRRRLATLVVLVGLSASAVTVGAAPATAATPAPAYDQPGCQSAYFLADKYEVNGGYHYTDTFTVPSASSCSDIWVTRARIAVGCCTWQWVSATSVRVRFFPSSGGSFANAWQWYDWSPNPDRSYPVATSVQNGTRWRLEWATSHLVDGRYSN